MCLLLFVAALALRLVGVDYGYFHGDERVNEAAKVLTGQIVPGQHFYPPFFNYLNAVAFGVLFVIGRAADWWDGAAGFRAQYFADPTKFYITARIVTASISALMAPLFFLTARRLKLDPLRALLVAMIAMLFPLAVFMAHIAKGDTGLATGLIGCFLAMLIRLQANRPVRWDIALGLCVLLTLSFKQSAVFVLGPLALGLIVLLIRSEGQASALKSFLRAMGLVLVLWPILNIGVILDFRNFLDFQRIQAVMSISSDQTNPLDGLTTLARRAIEITFGMSPVMAIIALLTPVFLLRRECHLPQKSALLVIWMSLAIGTVATALITGPRQPEHLWIGNFAGFLLLGGLVLADLTRADRPATRIASGLLLLGALGLSAMGTTQTLNQALAKPIHQDVETYLAETYRDRKIITSMHLELPQMKEAQQSEIDRLNRLARKYDTDLPEFSQERLIRQSAPDALYFVNLPGVMFGLENVDEEKQDYRVKAHAWPLQKEEWELPYWLSRGFSVFTIQDFDYYAYSANPEIRRTFFQTLARDCALKRSFSAAKPLFLEREVRVFDCAGP
ncbi:hypothetical protein [Thalassovita sp.]|uniref:ArnT family glycosyltransferase n=1 Tax=Thalassovita sp. TaxID=1979401 RepID=UPI002B278F13|nr:hypothetical protein [Thalassovita sp.]